MVVVVVVMVVMWLVRGGDGGGGGGGGDASALTCVELHAPVRARVGSCRLGAAPVRAHWSSLAPLVRSHPHWSLLFLSRSFALVWARIGWGLSSFVLTGL